MGGLLDGVRVLDLAGELGLFAGRMLAELGADVVRVEPPGGDGTRDRRPFVESPSGDGVSLYHLHFNAGKRSVQIDQATGEGRALLGRLLAAADIALFTEPRSHLEARGLDYSTLAARNPRLIHVTVTPFGDGPMAEYRANDLVITAMSGLMGLNGFPEDPPNVPGAEQGYHMAGLVAASTALMALAGRERDPEGRGREVTVSAQEAAAMTTVQTANANYFSWHGQVPQRSGMNSTGARNLAQCADGKWISFTIPVGTGPLWWHFVEWLDELGVEHECRGEEWADPRYRTPRLDTVNEAIRALCARLPRDEVFHEGQRRRLLVMPVNDTADLFVDAQLRDRGFFREVEHPALGRTLTLPGPAYHFTGGEAGITRPAPAPGEHTDEVLADWLGTGASS
ncbi:MAG: CoA transferase [Dehalococcoidia bacterium]|nr:CoA transferase [Dehalococcoidia bacterium]MCB9484253.1 CoA transferase [Dehalococcoidia bacterium]